MSHIWTLLFSLTHNLLCFKVSPLEAFMVYVFLQIELGCVDMLGEQSKHVHKDCLILGYYQSYVPQIILLEVGTVVVTH